MDSRANTTVQKTLNLKDVKEIPLPIPPHEERVSLEKIYFNFENRINLNIKINKILEEMSQNLFKSWFVDFDPVVDNALDAGNPIPEALQSRAELRQKYVIVQILNRFRRKSARFSQVNLKKRSWVGCQRDGKLNH